MEKPNWSLYYLINSHNKRTYLGVTNNLKRRLRQHNKEIKGGAKYTTAFKGNGEWEVKYLVENLTKKQACSYESLIKTKSKKVKINKIDLIKEICQIDCE